MSEPQPGATATVRHVVTEADTALAVGSGDVPVLGTPRLLALAEAATVAALTLDAGATTVGTRVELDHLAATPVGGAVTVVAELVEVAGRSLRFTVTATDDGGAAVATGTVVRAMVDRARFLRRVGAISDH
ncbi:MAG TPA: hotdog domain-containing protein [Pseudonocardiaceae bacterium]